MHRRIKIKTSSNKSLINYSWIYAIRATTKKPKAIKPIDTLFNATLLSGAGVSAGGVEIEVDCTGGTTGEIDGEMTGDGGWTSGGSIGDRAGTTSGVGTGDSTTTVGDGDGTLITEGGFVMGECGCLLCPGAWEITDPNNNVASIKNKRLL